MNTNNQFHHTARTQCPWVARRALQFPGLRFAILAWICLAIANAHCTPIIVPGILANSEGNSQSVIPLGTGYLHLQQVYAASEFSSLGGPAIITQIAFRPDGVGGHAFSATWTDLQVRLSTTTKPPDGLSTTFANNLGADTTTVFSGSWNPSSSFTGPAGGPKDFDIVLTLSTPFLYDPSKGNLLLDFQHYSVTSAYTLCDAQSVTGDGVSSVYAYGVGIENVTTGGAFTFGLATRFTFNDVPDTSGSMINAALLLPIGFSLLRRFGMKPRMG